MLRPHFTQNANIQASFTGWHLQIPASPSGNYSLAQLDNYTSLPRGDFPLNRQASLSLTCRASSTSLPGTWGFGFWNDPFAFSLGLQGMARRLPALPNACWFFNASPENHLSFDNQHPGSVFLAQTFRSPRIPSVLLLPAILGAPLLYTKTLSKWLRTIAGKLIREDSLKLDVDTTDWHTYELSWSSSAVSFNIDQAVVFQSPFSPHGPLGLVIWIDNQYAAWMPSGKISMGTVLLKELAWIEVEQMQIKK